MNDRSPGPALARTVEANDNLRGAERARTDAEQARRVAILAARASGASWASIAAVLGITRGRALRIAHPNGVSNAAHS